MPPEIVQSTTGSSSVQSTPVQTRREELNMLLAGVTETENIPKLTTEQVTQLIAQRSKIHEYVREDKKDNFELEKINRRNNLHILYVGSIGVVILSIFVLVFKI